jgi:hypothetical protein
LEVNLTIVEVKIQHDYKWGCDNLVRVLGVNVIPWWNDSVDH